MHAWVSPHVTVGDNGEFQQTRHVVRLTHVHTHTHTNTHTHTGETWILISSHHNISVLVEEASDLIVDTNRTMSCCNGTTPDVTSNLRFL